MNSRGMVFSADDVEIAINRRQNFVLAPCVDKLSLNGKQLGSICESIADNKL